MIYLSITVDMQGRATLFLKNPNEEFPLITSVEPGWNRQIRMAAIPDILNEYRATMIARDVINKAKSPF